MSSGVMSRRGPRTCPVRWPGRSTTRRCHRVDRRSSRSRWTIGIRRPTRSARARRPRGASSGAARRMPTRWRRSRRLWRLRATRCSSPDLTSTPAGGGAAAVALAERQRLAVWASPATGGSRIGFPESHPAFVGILPPAIGPIAETLKDHDLVLVVGSSVFPYYPYLPGPLLAPDTRLVAITSDAGEAARAPMGDAIVGDVAIALSRLVELVGKSSRRAPEPRPEPGEPPRADPLSGSEAMAALADAWPRDGIAVVETPSSTLALRNRLRLSTPGSYYFCASGGLGYGTPAAGRGQVSKPR